LNTWFIWIWWVGFRTNKLQQY